MKIEKSYVLCFYFPGRRKLSEVARFTSKREAKASFKGWSEKSELRYRLLERITTTRISDKVIA